MGGVKAYKEGKSGWDVVKSVAVGAGVGAVAGAAIGLGAGAAVASAMTGATASTVSTGLAYCAGYTFVSANGTAVAATAVGAVAVVGGGLMVAVGAQIAYQGVKAVSNNQKSQNITADNTSKKGGTGSGKVNYNGESSSVYRGGNDFNVKPNEVKINSATGNVKTSHGVSVDVNSSTVSKFSGAYRIDSLPEGLKIFQRGMRPEHFEIVPAYEMPFDSFQGLLNQIVVSGPY